MILLKHLQVENFKVLTSVDLAFPEQGAVLIEGLNEAGKSSLFEGIYFALYGTPLVSEEGRRRLEDVIRYGQNEALVRLKLEVGPAELEVRRHVRRGRTGATLIIRRPGQPEEVVQGVQPVNQRVVQELNGLDGDAVLNSCFIEQKKLDRLEGLSRGQREQSLLKLLNLDKLSDLLEAFRLSRQDDEALAVARDRLELAEAAAQLPELRQRRQDIERRLTAIEVAQALQEIERQERIQVECRQRIRELEEEKGVLKGRLERIGRLREALDTARRVQEHLRRAEELTAEGQQLEEAIRGQEPKLEEARRHLAEARERLRSGRVRAALEEWLRFREQAEKATSAEREVQEAGHRLESARQALAAAIATLASARRRVVRLGVLTLVLLLLGLIPGLVVYLLWTRRALGVLREARQEEASAEEGVADEEEACRQAQAQQEALRRLGGDPQRQLVDVQERLRQLGEPPPANPSAIKGRLDALRTELGDSTLAQLEAAEAAAIEEAQPLEDGRRQLEAELKAARDGLGKLDAKALAQDRQTLAAGLATLGWPEPGEDSSPAYVTLVQRLEEELRAADEKGTQGRNAELHHQLGEEQTRQGNAQSAIDSAQARIGDLLGSQGMAAPQPLTAAGVEQAYPLVLLVDPQEALPLREEQEQLVRHIGALEAKIGELRQRLYIEPHELDIEECRRQVRERERQRRLKEYATRILSAARDRMVRKVLPNTERNMAFILPLLTAQRYHEAQVTDDYRIQVWDEQAGRYVAKGIFSGGAKDQFSLALRLAFALATLPQELGATPGFIFLDEPLSSFDPPRTQSLVELLTRGQIAANFPQIFVISHNRSFDPESFPYRVVIEEGRVVESNLPLVQTKPAGVFSQPLLPLDSVEAAAFEK